MSGVKVVGEWKTPSLVFAKHNSQWKIVAQTLAKVDGSWKVTTFGSPPPKPVMAYVSTGVFRITNYDSTLVYEATRVSGSGTASFNATNQRYTLSDTTAAFNVTAKYAVGAPASTAGYMERKPYAYSCRQVTYTEEYGCNCRLDAGCLCCNCTGCANPSWGQCGCGPVPMCWSYYNGVVCDTCTRTVCCRTVCDVLIDETANGYTNSGSEWYKAS